MRTDHAESLLLVAREEADLEVVSALLQDAIIAGAAVGRLTIVYDTSIRLLLLL